MGRGVVESRHTWHGQVAEVIRVSNIRSRRKLQRGCEGDVRWWDTRAGAKARRQVYSHAIRGCRRAGDQ